MKVKIYTSLNYPHGKFKGEVNSGEILVQPDQSYSVEEILEKFSKGLTLPIGNSLEYPDDDQDFDDMVVSSYKDITEIDEVLESVNTKQKRKKQLESEEVKRSNEAKRKESSEKSSPE